MRLLLRRYATSPSKPASMPPGHIAVEDPERLLEPLRPQITRLAELADAIETHFARYYEPVLMNLGALLQKLPAPSVEHDNRSFFESRLDAAEYALQRRRAYLLPAGAEPETLAREADLWTYVIFTLSLLRGLGAKLSRYQIELFDGSGPSLGLWKPWQGPMAGQGACRYRVERTDSPPSADWTPILAGCLIPRQAHEWLWQNRPVLRVWLAVLSSPIGPPVIREILSIPDVGKSEGPD